jgi:hypothetical protein
VPGFLHPETPDQIGLFCLLPCPEINRYGVTGWREADAPAEENLVAGGLNEIEEADVL